MKRLVVLLTGVLLLSACTGDPYRNMYEGIKANSDAKRTPGERAASPSVSYDEYKNARDASPAK